MPTFVHEFDWPDRFVIDTIGLPGARTFYLQARSGSRLLSVALEKEQSAALAERIDEILDDLMSRDGNPHSVPPEVPEGLDDLDPLEQPIREQFRAGTMSLGWDPSTAQIVIEAFPLVEATDEFTDPSELEPAEALLVRIPVGAARAFAHRTRSVVEAGRPLCPLCGVPMDSEEHICELPEGFR